ncbi:gp16 family protein [Shewanella fidelis]|uniref:Regulatory protein GemA n=1 Tax=Shewanella fidelis TaxID=173509 RepID=A0AAW8NL04_9GAMM|nr:regulatory protein GemA [Shewanella fidelis]MDR8523450.1 regulatory protein GemA [Shewanella fidelis]MDW4813316.1 regulatory protein GemA [Shewanella fidelis]MDW4817312.1 regulatory protein GemA [Shewanella fidelis]MDW4821331.1 regulatory protein GemA [Shewanella fidelis]MDW4824591.1 regulatory protein GemA [Shewanella fidelis]
MHTTTSNTKRLFTLINIAKIQLQLDEALYRNMLKHVTGKNSLRAMTLNELEQVLECFKQKGFKPTRVKTSLNSDKKRIKRNIKGKRLSPVSGKAKVALIDKIRAIWITMSHHNIIQDGSETALDSYVRRMTKSQQQVDSVAWLNPQQANRVLESLKNWHRRELLERIQSRSPNKNANLNHKTLSYNQVVDLYLNGAYGGAAHE